MSKKSRRFRKNNKKKFNKFDKYKVGNQFLKNESISNESKNNSVHSTQKKNVKESILTFFNKNPRENSSDYNISDKKHSENDHSENNTHSKKNIHSYNIYSEKKSSQNENSILDYGEITNEQSTNEQGKKRKAQQIVHSRKRFRISGAVVEIPKETNSSNNYTSKEIKQHKENKSDYELKAPKENKYSHTENDLNHEYFEKKKLVQLRLNELNSKDKIFTQDKFITKNNSKNAYINKNNHSSFKFNQNSKSKATNNKLEHYNGNKLSNQFEEKTKSNQVECIDLTDDANSETKMVLYQFKEVLESPNNKIYFLFQGNYRIRKIKVKESSFSVIIFFNKYLTKIKIPFNTISRFIYNPFISSCLFHLNKPFKIVTKNDHNYWESFYDNFKNNLSFLIKFDELSHIKWFRWIECIKKNLTLIENELNKSITNQNNNQIDKSDKNDNESNRKNKKNKKRNKKKKINLTLEKDKTYLYYKIDLYKMGSTMECPSKMKGNHQIRSSTYEKFKNFENTLKDQAFIKNKYILERKNLSKNEYNVFIYNPSESLLKINGINIKKEDLYYLSPGIELNDSIIDMFLSYFYEKYPSKWIYIYNTHFYPLLLRNMKRSVQIPKSNFKGSSNTLVFKYKYLFIPICESQHWSLFVISYPGLKGNDLNFKRRSIISCDSLGDVNEMISIKEIQRYLKERYFFEKNSMKDFFPKFPLYALPMPQQRNHYDCGIYLISFVEYFLKNKLDIYHLEQVSERDDLTVNNFESSLELRHHYINLIHEISGKSVNLSSYYIENPDLIEN